MKLIVGLGNPGRLYVDSRHNVGFKVVKALAKAHKILLKKEKAIPALSGKGKIAGQNIIVAMPFTFMNLSGGAVRDLIKKYRIDLDNLLVACDDLDLDLGRLKIKSGGSSGGHRGLASVINSLGKDSFARLRIGIGRPAKGLLARDNIEFAKADLSDYVLSAFSKKESLEINQSIETAVDCCRSWVIQGINKSMNLFNRRSK